MTQEDAGLAPPPIDDPDVRKEIVLGLGLRKKQLEKLAQDETAAGITSKQTDLRLRLHARGIVGNFTEDTEGTMFEAVYPLKQLVPIAPEGEDQIMAIVIDDEEHAVFTLGEIERAAAESEGAVGPSDPDIEREAPLDLAEVRWIDANGKLFQLALHKRVEATLAPREIKALDDAVAELAGGTPGVPQANDIAEKRRQLALLAVEEAGAMKVTIREKIMSYIRHLNSASPEFQEFIDAWLDGDRSLDMKPLPPKDWEPPIAIPEEMTYEELLDDWCEAMGQKVTPVARLLLVDWEVPTQYLEVKDDVEGKARPKLTKPDIEDANNRYVNAVGSQGEFDVKEVVAIHLGKGKSSHLIISDEEREKLPRSDFFVGHTLCGREIGEGVSLSDAEALDDCCKNCVRVHDTAPETFRLTWSSTPDPAED